MGKLRDRAAWVERDTQLHRMLCCSVFVIACQMHILAGKQSHKKCKYWCTFKTEHASTATVSQTDGLCYWLSCDILRWKTLAGHLLQFCLLSHPHPVKFFQSLAAGRIKILQPHLQATVTAFSFPHALLESGIAVWIELKNTLLLLKIN